MKPGDFPILRGGNAPPSGAKGTLGEVRDEFVAQWGAIGSAWGINRTMAQIHALLLAAPQPMSTDEIMDDLHISRGNANTNLRDLVGWGLVRSVVRKGERREYFEAEKDVWKMFGIIVRERRRREITPAVEALHRCATRAEGLRGTEAEEFRRMLASLEEFLQLAGGVMDKVVHAGQGAVVPWALRLLK